MAIRHRNTGLDMVLFDGALKNIQIHAGAGMCRDFQRPHAQRFNGLEHAKISGALDCNNFAGLGNDTKAELQRLHCAAGDDDVLSGEITTEVE